MSSSIPDALRSLAPVVASALGGPLAGAAVTALGSIFGISEPTQDKITKMFSDGQLTADHLAEIRKLEMQYQDNEQERGFKYADLVFKDVDSARQMQIQTKSNVPALLAVLVTVGFFGILIFLVTNNEYKPTEPLLVMLGSLGTAWTGIIGYYFGSTASSQQKNELLAKIGK